MEREDARKQLIENLHQARYNIGQMKTHTTDLVEQEQLNAAISAVFDVNRILNNLTRPKAYRPVVTCGSVSMAVSGE